MCICLKIFTLSRSKQTWFITKNIMSRSQTKAPKNAGKEGPLRPPYARHRSLVLLICNNPAIIYKRKTMSSKMTEYGIWNVEYGIMQKNPPFGGFFFGTT